jgi:signal peptidase I
MKIKSFLLVLFIPVLCISCKQKFYRAGSNSMEKTLMSGEQFIMTETDNFNRDDLVVFNFYGNDYISAPDEETGGFKKHWEKRVFRLIAYSGDTLLIKNGEVYINGQHTVFPKNAMMTYQVTSDSIIAEFAESDPTNVSAIQSGTSIVYTLPLTKEEAEYCKHRKGVKEVKKNITGEEHTFTGLAIPGSEARWTVDNYGPLRVPKPGETIKIDTINFILYQNIPGIQTGIHVLKEKLYFVMGDNRHRAEDSRYIGFIPQSNMYGVVR